MKKYSTKILTEDASQFEKFIGYAADADAIKADAKDFAKQNSDNDKEQDDWYVAFESAYDDELGPYAETVNATFEDLSGYGDDAGESSESSEAAEIPNEDIPVDTEAPVEDQKKQFDTQLDEFEAEMDDFEASLEKVFEENPPPDDDEKSFRESHKKFVKYHDFLINRLYSKIGNYAVSKNRSDVVMLASKNVTVLRKWKTALETSMVDTWNEVLDNRDDSGEVKSYKPIIKIYDQATKDLASVIKTVKSNPLKALDAEKLTEGFRNQRNLLFEQRCKEIADFVTSLGD